MKMMQRRNFLGAAALSAMRIQGANDRIRAAVIGTGTRGSYHAAQFKAQGAEVCAVCDVYEPNAARGLKGASPGCQALTEFERVLDDKSIDVVAIAVPDHAHARIALAAMSAGKDIYLEKPIAHTLGEGFRIVDAAKSSGRIVQNGMQRRSSPLFNTAKGHLAAGVLGDVRLVTSYWLNRMERLTEGPLRGNLDWNRWLGSAPKRPADPVRFLNWYHFWDYGGGLTVAQAAHIVDVIQWFQEFPYPVAVTCTGSDRLPGAEAPISTSTTVEYPGDKLAVFTLGYQAMSYAQFHDQMIQFHGSKARMDVGREFWAIYPATKSIDLKAEMSDKQIGSFAECNQQHIRAFLECARSRKQPAADVDAAQSTNIAMAMIIEAQRTGRRVTYNPATRRISS
jgi:predicted dehydrogenase